MVAASASGAATKLTSPDPKLATAVVMALSTYVYIVVNTVMRLVAGIVSGSDLQRSRLSASYFFLRVFCSKKSASSLVALVTDRDRAASRVVKQRLSF